MKRKKAFTLIELLVVISIIALLLSILMPGLQKAKESAKNVLCRGNLKQWGVIYAMYVSDNDEHFYNAWSKGVGSGSSSGGHQWIKVVLPYYEDPKIQFCPSATKIRSEVEPNPTGYSARTSKEAWGTFPDTDDYIRVGYARMAGSYGINDWVGSLRGLDRSQAKGDPSNYIGTPLDKGSGVAPLFLGAKWLGGKPEETDAPPESDDRWVNGQAMSRYTVDRHNGSLNAVFVDFSVRNVGVRELWTLKWHKNFDRHNEWTLSGNARDSSAYQSKWESAAPWLAGYKAY